MRLTAKLAPGQIPDRQIGGIEQLEAAIGAEHGDTFVKMVDGLALYAGERVVRAFEIEPLRDIFIKIDDAAEGVRLGEQLDRAPVRQMPEFLDRFGRGVDFHATLFPGLKVRLFRQAAAGTQLIENFIVGGAAIEPLRIEIPERLVGAVAEGEALVGAANGDGCGDAVEGGGVAFDMAAQFPFRRVEVGHIDGDAGDAIRKALLGNVESPALTGHDGVAALAGALTVKKRAAQRGERFLVQKFKPL